VEVFSCGSTAKQESVCVQKFNLHGFIYNYEDLWSDRVKQMELIMGGILDLDTRFGVEPSDSSNELNGSFLCELPNIHTCCAVWVPSLTLPSDSESITNVLLKSSGKKSLMRPSFSFCSSLRSLHAFDPM